MTHKTRADEMQLAEHSDIEQLQTTGATPVHNPLSNLRLGRCVRAHFVPLPAHRPPPTLAHRFALLKPFCSRDTCTAASRPC
jgi:hypothetical protein